MSGRIGKCKEEWQRVKLGELCDLVNGDAYRETDWNTSGVPIIRIQNLNNHDKPFNYWQGSLDDRVVVNDGDVLLAWSGTPGTSFGTHIWERGLAVLNQHIFRVDLDKSRLDAHYAVFGINEQLDEMIGRAHGAVGLRHVTRGEVESLEIPLPPMDEQRRIAARLREQLAAVSHARAALEAQLSAADALLAANVRAVFQSAEAQRWPRGKIGYLVASPLRTGISKSAKPDSPWRCLGLSSVRDGKLIMDAAKPVDVTEREAESSRIRAGAFYVVRGNGNLKLVARGALAPETVTEPILFPDLLIEVNPDAGRILPLFLRWVWDSAEVRMALESRSRTSAGIHKINLRNLADIVIPLPPLAEQRAIAARLDAEFSASAELLRSLRSKLAEVEKLPAALLRAAFQPQTS